MLGFIVFTLSQEMGFMCFIAVDLSHILIPLIKVKTSYLLNY